MLGIIKYVKTLFEKILEVIDKHIDEKIENILDERELNKKTNKRKTHKKEVNKRKINKKEINKKEIKDEPFVDIFGNSCNLDEVTKDHVYPKSKGGANSITNIIPICKVSNVQKSDMLEGIINEVSFKININKKSNIKNGEVGILNIRKPNSGLMQSISADKERKRFTKYKNS